MVLQSHNAKILTDHEKQQSRDCNCRNKNLCPIPSKCCTKTVIYKAELTDNKFYIGSTEGEFKTRYNGHKQSFNTEYKRSSTTLSQHVWDNKINPSNISWSIIRKATPYQPGQRACNLCLSEKIQILKHLGNNSSLNKRNEISNPCMHKTKFKLNKLKPP